MGKGVIIGVIVVAAIIGIGAYAMLAESSEANIRINLSSNNYLNDLDVFVYVDGKLIANDTMKASLTGSAAYLDHTVKFSGNSTTITVKAVSQGGLLGTITDSKQVIVVNGGNYTVNLNV